MNQIMDGLLGRFGQTVFFFREDGWTETRAFLQPFSQRDETVPSGAMELGWLDDRKWRCLCRDCLREGDRVRWEGLEFHVLSSRAVYLGRDLCHWRALLELRGEEP